MSPRITLISRTLSPADAYGIELHTPPSASPTRHELHIDLTESNGPETPDPAPISNVRAAVALGDVDAVAIFNGSPTAEEWDALEGAKPWHLELEAGSTETFYYEGLKRLVTPWPLRSVYTSSQLGSSEQ